jgi:hypothetical protein
MAKLTSSQTLYNMTKDNQRQNRLEQGFFDGRFMPKLVPDKKKQKSKSKARKKIPAYAY